MRRHTAPLIFISLGLILSLSSLAFHSQEKTSPPHWLFRRQDVILADNSNSSTLTPGSGNNNNSNNNNNSSTVDTNGTTGCSPTAIPGQLLVLSPNFSTRVQVGDTLTIIWRVGPNTNPPSSNISIYLHEESIGGSGPDSYRPITTKLPADATSYNWNIPQVADNNDYTILVVADGLAQQLQPPGVIQCYADKQALPGKSSTFTIINGLPLKTFRDPLPPNSASISFLFTHHYELWIKLLLGITLSLTIIFNINL